MTLATSPPSRRWRVASALLVLGILFGLFVLGATPVAVKLIPSPWDQLAHVAVFAVLACALGLLSGQRGARLLLFAVAGALLIGALDEWRQMYLPGRQPGWDDLMMDAIGGLIGGLSGATLLARWQSHVAGAARHKTTKPAKPH
jgi:VanZ family protein